MKFFQAVDTERYHRNNITCLHDEVGNQFDDHPAKEAPLFQTYKDRLGTTTHSEMRFDLPTIIQRAPCLDQLTDPFTHAEIDDVVKEMPADRAPDLDGFSGSFLKACWPIIKHDFYNLCS